MLPSPRSHSDCELSHPLSVAQIFIVDSVLYTSTCAWFIPRAKRGQIGDLHVICIEVGQASALGPDQQCILIVRVEDGKEVSLEEKQQSNAEELTDQDVEVRPALTILEILVLWGGPWVFQIFRV